MKSPINTRAVPQEPYISTQHNPYFDDLLNVDDTSRKRSFKFDYHETLSSQTISRSTSDVSGKRFNKLDLGIPQKSIGLPSDDLVSDLSVNSIERTSSETWSRIAKTSTFANNPSASGFKFDDPNESVNEFSPRTIDHADVNYTPLGIMRPATVKSYSVSKRKLNLSKIPLPQSAASFYNGYSPQIEIVELCRSVNRLNTYLKARRDDVNAGVPGRFLRAVIGQDVSDVGSIASTIMYAFYLNETLESDQLCTVPVINMRKADLNSHAELKWLLDSCQIDQSSLIFVDEIDLSYYDLFGSLKVVLLNGHKLPAKQEALKEAIVGIFNCKKGESVYPWVQTTIEGQDCSCCTLIAEKFALTSPEILVGQGFSRLLLAGILLDTENLTNPNCTHKDKYMTTLLINGAGRFGCNGLYQLLRYKMSDVSDLKLVDILRKDFKKWTRVGKQDSRGSRMMASYIGMSSIGISVEQLIAHDNFSTQEIRYFQQSEKLGVLMIVSGYYDQQKNLKREILVSADSADLIKNMLMFFISNASQLQLKVLHQPGLRDDMRAFEIDKATSLKTIERILQDFARTSKFNASTNNVDKI